MSSSRRVFLGTALWTAAITAMHASMNVNWRRVMDDFRAPGTSKTLIVGGLPVTCNLTLPVSCLARKLDNDAVGNRGDHAPYAFEYARYNGWPELKESLIANRVQAAYMLAPLVMDLAAKQVPVKIVSLGHRSGAVIMVRADAGHRTFADLAGKRIAIPSRFAVDYLFLRKMLANEGMSTDDVQVVEMAPPDMPAALFARAVDAYCTGEPFGAAAERAGYAVPLRTTRDEWPNYICCVLTVREELIHESREMVQLLVNYIQGSGSWLDDHPSHRARAAQIAAQRQYFNQDPAIIQYVMENPPDRVTYGDLRLLKEEFDDLMRLSVGAKTLKESIAFEKYVDESFVRNAVPAPISI